MIEIALLGEVMIEMAPVGDGLYRRGVAGDTYNTACTIAGLGGEVRYLTSIGRGEAADTIRAHAGRRAVSLVEPGALGNRMPGLYMISNDETGERQFDYWRDRSAARAMFCDANLLSELMGKLSASSWLYVSGITLALMNSASRSAFGECVLRHRAGGGVVAFDPNFRPALWGGLEEAKEAISNMLELTDIYLPGSAEEQQLFARSDPKVAAAALAQDGLQEVLVKNGPEDCLLFSGGGQQSIHIKRFMAVLDATGAGDTFNGGYLSARLRGWSPSSAASFAGRVAQEVLTVRGGVLDAESLQALSEAFKRQ